jgi:hypothetical protein
VRGIDIPLSLVSQAVRARACACTGLRDEDVSKDCCKKLRMSRCRTLVGLFLLTAGAKRGSGALPDDE